MATANTTRSDTAHPNDFYTTPPSCVEDLLKRVEFKGNFLEPCSGTGRISKVLIEKFGEENVTEIDKFDYGRDVVSNVDFLDYNRFHNNIITNPPYKLALEFVKHSLNIVDGKVAMLLRINFLETLKRGKFLKGSCLKTVLCYSNRVKMWKDDVYDTQGSAVFYAWFVFDKNYNGEPTIDWILDR